MTRAILLICLIVYLAVPASALEIEAPQVPESAEAVMPEDTSSFGNALWQLLKNVVSGLRPELKDALGASASVLGSVLLTALGGNFSRKGKKPLDLAAVGVICVLLLQNSSAMIALGADTIAQLSEYGKLLLPVMASALAAQGGVTSSAALYAGTAVFDAVLSSAIEKLLLPMVYLFLALAAANAAAGEAFLKRLRDMVKGLLSWSLKLLLTIFTTYMSITGVVSGTTDAAALKATKVTISSLVPVVGGILSDASEAVLVSAGVMKSAAGVYGVLAILALFLEPFLRIGIQYLVLKATAALGSLFGTGEISGLIEDFAAAMGLLLAMTGAACVILLLGTVCFMKGVG